MNQTICPLCGLPGDLCMCNTIAKEKQQVVITKVKRRYGKIITEIHGIDAKMVNIKDLAKQLKTKLACGGTVKDGKIELQGLHTQNAKAILVKLGFTEDSIVVK